MFGKFFFPLKTNKNCFYAVVGLPLCIVCGHAHTFSLRLPLCLSFLS